jgi:hypothetical protein
MDSSTQQKKPTRSNASKRKLAGISRWLHIYLSMVSFAIVLFFSVTGITLNHADSMQGETKTTQVKGKLNAAWVQSPDTNKVEKLLIAEYFRNSHAVKGAVNDLRIEESQISIAYKGPGYEAVAFINRTSGEYELTVAQTGFVGFMNDLHKGRDTGKTWAWVIDIAAGLMVLISLTGLILLLFIKRKRMNGLILLAAGTIIVYLLYRIWGQ